MGTIRVGVSGWDYPGWRGVFYPDDLPARRRLPYLASLLDTVEVNSTFYRLPTPAAVQRWHDALPAHAVLAVKGSRYITHTRHITDVRQALANYFAAGVLLLGSRLGPVLWQLPPRQRFDAELLEGFLASLPHDTADAAALADEHDDRVRQPAVPDGHRHRLRHVLEVRHPSFLVPEAMTILRHHGIALAFSHSNAWPYAEEVTAGSVYLRLHGPDAIYASEYPDLDRWAERIRRWHAAGEPDDAVRVTPTRPPPRKERDVYVYFDNDQGARAPRQAIALRRILGLPERSAPS